MNEENYYYKRLHELNDLKREDVRKKASFWQHILLVSSTVLGILVALHYKPIDDQYTRLVFLLSILLLLLGILTSGTILYAYANTSNRLSKLYQDEVQNALTDNRKVETVFDKKKKITSFCEITAVIFLVSGMLALFAYALMINLSE